MKLNRIEIHNFRSIKDATVFFDKKCRILIGKNECGKSNVLKAIASVFGEYKVSSKDKRKKIENERIDSYYVRAFFSFSDEEIKGIASIFEKDNVIAFSNNKTLLEYLKATIREFIIAIDIDDNSEPIYEIVYLQDNSFEALDNGITIQESRDIIKDIAISFYVDYNFKCHFWSYSKDYLLPYSVNVNSFITRPESFKSLSNIFLLSDRENIKVEFEEAQKQDGDYLNLLEQVSSRVTTIFRTIWPDFKDTSIQLLANGETFLIKVANRAKYTFEDRSDGFKHFTSILLMLSAPSQKGKIGPRDIILIDRPDNSLYPSSANYLREELLRIGKKAYIVYATHSPYMLDKECIERHIIVEKSNDITSLHNPTQKSPFSNDELLLNAIGTSIFECIQHRNLVFEGWLDKMFFEKFLDWNKELKNSFDTYGKVYLHGINGAITLCQLLMLANKDFFIVADSDEVSNNKKKDFINNYPKFKNNWVDYAQFCGQISTVEDFLKREYVEDYLKKNVDSNFIFDKTKSTIKNLEKATKSNTDQIKKIKAYLIENAELSNVKVEEYNTYIQSLIKIK